MWFFRRKKPVNSLPDRDEHLTGYILKYYSHLMTVAERKAQFSLMKEAKARSGLDSYVEHFSDELKEVEALMKAKADDLAEVLKERNANRKVKTLLANGATAFYQSTRDRILKKHSKKIYFNLCPKCKALANTPTAKQCRKCFYSWHEM